MDFTSSITLKFNDLFSAGFSQARNSITDLHTALEGISNTGLEGLVPKSLPQPIVPQPLVPQTDMPQPVVPPPLVPQTNMPQPVIPAPEVPPPKTSIFDAGLKQIQGGLDRISQNTALNTVATQLSTMAAMTAPLQKSLATMMDEPSRLAGTFESSMKNIQAITGLSAREIAVLGNELNTIGGSIAAGPLAVADAYNDVAGGITKVSAQMPVMTNAIALAESGQADLSVATNGLVKIMNSYNFTVGEVAEVNQRAAWTSDVMTQAVGMGVGSMNEFISAMAPVSGIAASVGIGFDEIGSTMAYMSATTDSAATAGTKLAAFMTALQKPSDSLALALKTVGIHSGSAMLAEYGLAESARIVSRAFNGNQDAITQAMGRQEAMGAIISLTGEAYTDFATQFGATMDGITAGSQAIQVQSYESKVARLTAATDTLTIHIGTDINEIKGFFVDVGTSFLTQFALPIMASPVGGVIAELGAVAGIGAQGLLSFGSGALTVASQMSVLAANIQNAGGYLQMFRGVLSVMGAPLGLLKTALAAPLGGLKTLALSFWSVAGGIWAAIAPALPFIAIGLAIAYLAYHIISSWDPTKGFFENIWNGIVQAFSAAWEKVKAIWGWIKGLFTGGGETELAVTSTLTETNTPASTPASAGIDVPNPTAFGSGLTEQLTGLTNNVIPQTQTALAGLTATGDMTPILPDMTGTMPDMTPMPMYTGPLADSVPTTPKNELVAEHLAAATRKGIAGIAITHTASSAFADAGANWTTTITPTVDLTELNKQAQANPYLDSLAGATATITPTVDMTELNKQAQANPYLDSLAGATATITPTVDMTELNKQVSMTFPDAMPRQQQPFDVPLHAEAPKKEAITRSITVQNVNINVDELFKMTLFFHQLEHAVLHPQEVMA